MDTLIIEMAPKYKMDHKLGSDDEAVAELKSKMGGATAQMHGTTVG